MAVAALARPRRPRRTGSRSALVPSAKGTISLLTPARRMLRSISRACPASSSIMTIATASARIMPPRACPRRPLGEGEPEGRALAERGVRARSGRRAFAPAAHMRKPVPLARPVLGAGAAEQVEDAPVVARVDAAAVVADLVDETRDPRRDRVTSIRRGRAGVAVLHGVVEEVAEDLLDREPVADEGRAASPTDRSSRRSRRAWCCRLSAMPREHRLMSIGSGLKRPSPLAGQAAGSRR